VRLEEEGHQVTIRSVELPSEVRATEIAGTFELSAARLHVASRMPSRLAPSHLCYPELWTGGPGLRWWSATPDERLLVRCSW